MFAYCLNNPPLHYDNQGREAVRIDLADGDKDGDGMPDEPAGGSSGSSGTSGSSSSNGTPSAIQVVAGSSGTSTIVVSNPNGEPTEMHHIVEQCQEKKSGFSGGMIQDGGNIVEIPYSLHRRISGHYSSIQDYTQGLRVRDWLAGQSFEFQTQYGKSVLIEMWGALYG